MCFEALQAACEMPPCCLDPTWGQPVQERIKAAADKEACFAKHMTQFLQSFRSSSLQEEFSHALQRTIAGGSEGQARRQHSQCARFVLSSLARCYTRLGGRDLQSATPQTKQAAKSLRVRKVHKRPNQTGFAGWTYVAHHKQRGSEKSQAELLREWKEMHPDNKAIWKSRHRVAVHRRKQQ